MTKIKNKRDSSPKRISGFFFVEDIPLYFFFSLILTSCHTGIHVKCFVWFYSGLFWELVSSLELSVSLDWPRVQTQIIVAILTIRTDRHVKEIGKRKTVIATQTIALPMPGNQLPLTVVPIFKTGI